VSHPNVCRVYDIAEADGQPFLTMEYVDGEDLAGLLRRVGRLPEEKATQIARELCAALAAVHDEGLLHRDLKPANVMLDGRGKVRLTDFGLAAVMQDLSAADLRCGTPQYMAPEQLAGKPLTPQTDLFALGSVLYEIFTGHKAFAGADRAAPLSRPSGHIAHIDPAVERVILRCLEPDPKDRPRSAYEVMAGLPGGDPLAAALAAGQTPSPEAVANAPIEGTLRPAVALALLAAVLLGMWAVARLNDRTRLFRLMPLAEASPEVLSHRAHEILQILDYPDPPAGRAAGYAEDGRVLQASAPSGPAGGPRAGADPSPGWEALTAGRPSALFFWYRQGPAPLTNRQVSFVAGFRVLPGCVTPSEPPLTVPGMVTVALDLRGRLLEFRAVPPRLTASPPADAPSAEPPDWSGLFRAAGLDISHFRGGSPPRHTPPVYADVRQAWDGADPDHPGVAVRAEAASFQGRPVYFYVGPPDDADRLDRTQRTPSRLVTFVISAIIIGIFTGGAVLAWQNVRRGLANVRGAGRLAACAALLHLLAWALLATHVPSFGEEVGILCGELGFTVFGAGLLWVWYLALEPFIRRRWPWMMVGWNRLLDGRWRDPLVGRDVLIGALVGVIVALLIQAQVLLPGWLGRPTPPPLGLREDLLGHGPAFAIVGMLSALFGGMGKFFTLALLIVFLRRVVFGVAAAVVLDIAMSLAQGPAFGAISPSAGPVAITAALQVVSTAVAYAVLLRFGYLTFLAGLLFSVLLTVTPLTTDLSAWYVPAAAVTALTLVALATYAAITSLGGRPLFPARAFID
jgi:serine/threonine-protein kinase